MELIHLSRRPRVSATSGVLECGVDAEEAARRPLIKDELTTALVTIVDEVTMVASSSPLDGFSRWLAGIDDIISEGW